MNAQILVSVIIPAYNAGKYIEKAVQSVFKQTYPNIEIIVVNDGSTDDTLDVLSRFPEVKIVSTLNKGVSHARNVGIEASRGEYISFLDADDELECDAIESLLKSSLKNNADICAGLLSFTHKKEDGYTEHVIGGDALLRYCIEDNPYTNSACAKIYKRSFVDKTRFALGMRAHEDSFFIFELALEKPKCVLINKTIYFIVAHESSASRKKNSDSFLDINKLAKIKYEMVLDKYPQYKDYAKNILIKANMASLGTLVTYGSNHFKDYEKKCIKDICDNAKYFIPAIKSDKKIFFIVTHHLYWLAKKYLLFRNAVRKIFK